MSYCTGLKDHEHGNEKAKGRSTAARVEDGSHTKSEQKSREASQACSDSVHAEQLEVTHILNSGFHSLGFEQTGVMGYVQVSEEQQTSILYSRPGFSRFHATV